VGGLEGRARLRAGVRHHRRHRRERLRGGAALVPPAGVGRREHLGFAALHVVQIAAVAWAYRDGDLGYVAAGMVWLLGAVAVLLWAPLYLRRTLALCAVLAGVVLLDVACSPTPGLEWFAAAFYLKLLAAHANREAPFAPAGAS
jgi:hypothetical protein